VVEKDGNSFITGSHDGTLKEWNKTTCECLTSLELDSIILCLMITKDKSRLVCGMQNGYVEMRRVSDLGLISCLEIHFYKTDSICELEDGSFISASYCDSMKWWEERQKIQTFPVGDPMLHGRDQLQELTLLKLSDSQFVIGSQDKTIQVWNSKGECIETLYTDDEIDEMVRVGDSIVVNKDRLVVRRLK